jgi:hypothetical protein
MLKKILLTVVILGVVVVALVVAGGYFVYDKYKEMTVTEATFDGIPQGSTQAQVKAALPADAEVPAKDVYKNSDAELAVPAGAECLHYLARGQAADNDGARVYRFCFKGGKLTDKKTVRATG